MATEQKVINLGETEKVFSKDFVRLSADSFTILQHGDPASPQFTISFMKTILTPDKTPTSNEFTFQREIVATLEVSGAFLDSLEQVRHGLNKVESNAGSRH